jgi:hypothetical protein
MLDSHLCNGGTIEIPYPIREVTTETPDKKSDSKASNDNQ